MSSALNLVTPPTCSVVTLDEAKRHLRVEVPDDDALIQAQLEAAEERIQLETGRQLLTATWELWLHSFPGMGHRGLGSSSGGLSGGMHAWGSWSSWNGLWHTPRFIDVPCAPLQAVVSLTYVDTSGVTQTWDPSQYQVHAPRGPQAERGKVQPAYGISWPVTQDQLDAVIVRFTAGYGTTGASVPRMLRRAVLLVLGDLYENREDTVVTERRVTVQPLPYGVESIVSQYRARPISRQAA